MSKSDNLQTKGRSRNAAEPLGKMTALGGADAIKRTGKKARASAGPDGPSAEVVGDTFKRK